MGTELRVTRLRAGAVEPITDSEWLDFVHASPDFVESDEVSVASPVGGEIVVRGRFGCWTGHPTAELVPFRWSNGVVTVAFDDEHAIEGALLVADALAATVVGDDGEEYDTASGRSERAPAWQFPESEPHREPVATRAPIFDTPPQREDVAYDFDGGETIWDRVLPWLRRQRRG